jgi:hypothetical protein
VQTFFHGAHLNHIQIRNPNIEIPACRQAGETISKKNKFETADRLSGLLAEPGYSAKIILIGTPGGPHWRSEAVSLFRISDLLPEIG